MGRAARPSHCRRGTAERRSGLVGVSARRPRAVAQDETESDGRASKNALLPRSRRETASNSALLIARLRTQASTHVARDDAAFHYDRIASAIDGALLGVYA